MPGGANMQTPNLIRAHLRQPTQHRAHTLGLQGLFGRPQALGRGVGIDADQAVVTQAFAAQARQVRELRRANQQDAAPLADKPGQGRAEQAPFSLPHLGLQDLGHGMAGPTATR